MMRKTLILCMFAAIGMVGCGSTETKTDTTTTSTSSTQTTTNQAQAEPPKPAVPDATELKIEDTKLGTGATVEEGDLATVTYRGTLTDGTEFESTMGADTPPLAFVVGAKSVITGWDKGLLGMKAGGERTLTIPPAMAYGKDGSPPKIGPDATLIFKIKLWNVIKKGQENEYTKKVVKEGSGEGAKLGDTISVHYVGTFVNGKKFDSSRDRNAPYDVTLGQQGVIKGWDPGLVGIKKGERRIMTIAPGIAYGEGGRGADMPGNMVLIFDIECMDIKRGG